MLICSNYCYECGCFSDDIQHCLECGMNAHIAKPIDVMELTRMLKRYLI